MNVMLSIFRTIFLRPSASMVFTFSRSAFDSSPRTIRPSRATTETPSTSRFVIFNATFVSSSFSLENALERIRRQPNPEPKTIPKLARWGLTQAVRSSGLSDVIGARHVIAAPIADQLTPARFQPLRADGTIAQSVLSMQLGSCRFRGRGRYRGRFRKGPERFRSPGFVGRREALHGTFHGGQSYSTTSPPADRGRRDLGAIQQRQEPSATQFQPFPVYDLTFSISPCYASACSARRSLLACPEPTRGALRRTPTLSLFRKNPLSPL